MAGAVWRTFERDRGVKVMGNLIPVQVKGNIGTIEDNLNEVELSIREKVSEYSAVVVTEDTIKDGKKFLADIRKEKKSLDDERKAIKSQWMAPYEAFERRAKQIIALYDEPVKLINEQLEEYESQRREMKRQGIREVYDFVKSDLADWLPLERIYNPKWENATYSCKKVREDMELVFDQMKVSISTVKSMNSEFETDALRVLKESGSLQAAISEINELQRQKERFMEQARLEAEREMQKSQPLADGQTKDDMAAEQAAVGQEEPVLPYPDEKLQEKVFGPVEGSEILEAPFSLEKTVTVMVRIGENDLGMLKKFLETAGFEYEVI